jgi:hypothetical protein
MLYLIYYEFFFEEFQSFFWGIFRIFGNTSVIFGFILVLWEKVVEFGHHDSTGKIGILEDF